MRPTLTLIRREFTAYFLSPIPYVVLTVFVAGMGILFNMTLVPLTDRGPRGIEYPMQGLLGSVYFWIPFLLIPSLLTMRQFAEERATGTLEMLLTAPVRDWQVVLAKYVACLGFYIVLWIPTLVYLPVLVNFDWNTRHPGIDAWPVVTSYIGLLLAGGMFLALGLFVSSLVRSQMVAVLISFVLSLGFVLPALLQPDMDTASLEYRLRYFFTVPLHFSRDFARGVIDTRYLVLYASVALCCLFLTVRSLERRRWQ